jgi:hypothetical protein
MEEPIPISPTDNSVVGKLFEKDKNINPPSVKLIPTGRENGFGF